MVRVLFVCLGNICRSPTAEGVMRAMLADAGLEGDVDVESAGTGSWHSGEGADPRSVRAAARRGYDLSRHRARSVVARDFDDFDYVLAMDRENLRNLRRLREARAGSGGAARVGLFLDFAPKASMREVPDPYSEGPDGFELVLDLLEEASRGFLGRLRRERDEGERR